MTYFDYARVYKCGIVGLSTRQQKNKKTEAFSLGVGAVQSVVPNETGGGVGFHLESFPRKR